MVHFLVNVKLWRVSAWTFNGDGMKKWFIILLLLTGCLFRSFAQDTGVQGTVKDAKGIPVPGVVIQLDDSSRAALSNLEGLYLLEGPVDTEKSVLNISCLGYKTQQIKLQGRRKVDIILEEDVEQLDESVVVGYGSMRKSDLTGAVSSVRVDEVEASHNNSISQLLQGRAAGVQVVSNSAAPDAGVSIRIRGLNTFSGDTQPLYVVDGIIMNTAGDISLISAGDDNSGTDEETNGLMGLNPQDIESIDILKDASATAIYGSQGANGVVLITTKSAKQSKPSVTFSEGLYLNTPYKYMDMMSFDDFIGFLDIRAALNDVIATSARTVLGKIYDKPDTREGCKVEPMDWQRYLMQPSHTAKTYLAFSGKGDNTSYRISMGYTRENGVIRTTGFDNLTSRIKLEHKVNRRISLGNSTGFSYLNSNLTQGASTKRSGAASSMMRSMLAYPPYRALSEETEETELDPDADEYRSSPEKWITDFENKRREIRLTASQFIEIKLLPWMAFKSTLGGDYRSTEQGKWKSSRINSTSEGTVSAIGRVSRLNWNFDNQFQFYKKYTEQKISGTLGFTMSSARTLNQTIQGWNIPQFSTRTDGINSAVNSSLSLTDVRSSLMSFFGRSVYSLKDRYSLTATLRLDGSSKFASSNKWALFPSFAAAWRVSGEPWFRVPVVSSLKLRAGWGQVGNQAISPYQTQSNYSNGLYAGHEGGTGYRVAIYPSNIANPDLKWETTDQLNLGLDMSLWQGAVSLSAEAYYKNTRNLLQEKKLATSTGFQRMYMNMGNIRNTGFELTVDTWPVRSYYFEWGVGGNISLNRNSITSIGEGAESGALYLSPDNKVERNYFFGNVLSSSYCPSPLNMFIEGEPMGVFYGMPTDGILGPGEIGVPMESGEVYTQGQIRYVDTNGDGVISEKDRVIIGDPNPDFTFGFHTSLRYRNLNMKMTFTGVAGNEIYNVNKIFDTYVNGITRNLSRRTVTDAWSETNTGTWYTSITGMTARDIQWISDRYVEDGSYLRLSDLTISYNVPLKKAKLVKGLTVSLSGANLFVWTRYSGWDPDVNSFANAKLTGADLGSYPTARSFRMDMKLNF